jgi:hypothetical protein
MKFSSINRQILKVFHGSVIKKLIWRTLTTANLALAMLCGWEKVMVSSSKTMTASAGQQMNKVLATDSAFVTKLLKLKARCANPVLNTLCGWEKGTVSSSKMMTASAGQLTNKVLATDSTSATNFKDLTQTLLLGVS